MKELKTLDIKASTILKENDEILAESSFDFILQPNVILSDIKEYINLPTSEKAKIDEMTSALWTDSAKAKYQEFLDS